MNEKLERLSLLKRKVELHEGLPHLYSFKWYKWAKEFFESENKFNFLCAGNQVSKSSSQIRKAIHWATEKELWPKLWATRPQQFWYFYPNQEVVRIEVTKKWMTEFLPRNAYKDSPKYGWTLGKEKGDVTAIHFNSGVSIFFRCYTQQVTSLQASSPHAIFLDEELPFELFPELSKRLLATDGHFHMVFTATLGQEEWKDTIEPTKQKERFKGAAKWQVSLERDCRFYEDGTPSPWTDERIVRAKNSCQSLEEVAQRIHGKFIVAKGRRYESFGSKNIIPDTDPHWKPGQNWKYYIGVDNGTGGGGRGHPAAISFVAVDPDFSRGIVFRGWKGGDESTTASDILDKLIKLRGDIRPELQTYDWSAKDFYIIASRMGETFVAADKARDSGDAMLNTLFKNDMLMVYDIFELYPLIYELRSLRRDEPKTSAKDDAADSLRYAVTKIPWNWDLGITGGKEIVLEKQKSEIELRREMMAEDTREGYDSGIGVFTDIEAELDAVNEWYDA